MLQNAGVPAFCLNFYGLAKFVERAQRMHDLAATVLKQAQLE